MTMYQDTDPTIHMPTSYELPPAIDPARWESIRNRLIDEQERGQSLESFAKVAGVHVSSLGRWLSAPDAMPIYSGMTGQGKSTPQRIAQALEQYFSEIDERGLNLRDPCPYSVETSVTRTIFDGISRARAMCVPMLIDAPPGIGKTEGIKRYISRTRKAQGFNCPVWSIKLTEDRLTLKSVYTLIARQILGGDGYDEKNDFTVAQAIEAATEGRAGVLIIDEAQHLGDAEKRNGLLLINALRRFSDGGHFGIALFGNGEIYRHLKKGNRHTQILSRMDAFRLEVAGLGQGKNGQPALLESDVLAVMDAWHVKGDDLERWCLRAAQAPGSLRNVTNAFRLCLDQFEAINLSGLQRIGRF
jgi:hypothetical protein